MSKTGIPYLDEVLNVTTGCTKVSEGCANCYAERIKLRFGQSPAYDVNCPIRTHSERLEEALRWQRPRRAGVCFASDLFHDEVSDEFIDKVFAVMALTPQHTYLLLTKRPERMRAYLSWQDEELNIDRSSPVETAILEMGLMDWLDHVDYEWPLPNVWLGVSVENQHWADERIPLLLETPAAHRWASLEPLLEAVNLRSLSLGAKSSLLGMALSHLDALAGTRSTVFTGGGSSGAAGLPRLDWVVLGGESGPKARPCHIDWIRDGSRQCGDAGVKRYVKQLGTVWAKRNTPRQRYLRQYLDQEWPDSKGENMVGWPPDLRVRELPEEVRDAR